MQKNSILAALLAALAFPAAQAASASGASVLLVQDEAPWTFTSNEEVLASLGVAHDTVGSAGLAEVKLADYSTVIVASVQSQAFYDALAPYAARIGKWLRGGARTLEFHGATYSFGGYWTFALPLGVTGHVDMERKGVVADRSSPLVAGLPATLRGDYASHTSFELGQVDASRVVTEAFNTGGPTTLDYCVGRGRVIATGMAVEFAYKRELNFAGMLPNMIAASTTAPGCPQ